MEMKRHTRICNDILYLDGLSGSGKGVLTPLLSTFDRVEKVKFEHIYEYLCGLSYLKKIEEDAGIYMMRMLSDISLFNSMISRETNFRLNDQSGVFNNPHTLRYFKRLLKEGDDEIIKQIKETKPVLYIMTHQILPVADLAFKSFEKRMKIIEMVRHPLYLLDHWHIYVNRYGKDPRDFTLWIKHKDNLLPWFAKEWKEKYAKSTLFDKVIYSIDFLLNKTYETYDKLYIDHQKNVLFIPFEKFVLEPNPFIKDIEKLLNTKRSWKTKRVLSQEKVPRKMVTAGPAKELWKRYGLEKIEKGQTEKTLYEQKMKEAKRKASKQAFSKFEKLCKNYEDKYGLWF
jgi:hypothetical protein